MKSSNRHTLIVTVALFAVLGLMLAAHASAGPVPRVIQQKTLVAKAKPQTWTSTDKGNVVYVHVYGPDGSIAQRWVNNCRANYPDPANGLYVWVRIKECHRPGSHPFVVRYVSVSGPQRFSVQLTSSQFA